MKTIFICSNCKTVQTDDDEEDKEIKDPIELSNMLYANAFTPNQLVVLKVSRCHFCKDKPKFERGGW